MTSPILTTPVSKSAIMLVSTVVLFILVSVGGYRLWGELLIDFPAYPTAKRFIALHPMVEKKFGTIKSWDPSPSGNFDYDDKSGRGHLLLRIQGSLAGGEVKIEFSKLGQHDWRINQAFLKTEYMADFLKIETVTDWENLAYLDIDARNFDSAQSQCDLISQTTPGDYVFLFCLGEIAWARGDKTEYLRLRRSILDKDQKSSFFHEQLAYAYRHLERLDESVVELNQAWVLSEDPYLAAQLAFDYFKQKDLENGKAWLDKVINSGYESTDVDYIRGLYFLLLDDFENARFFFQKTIRQNPNYADAYFGLAELNEKIDIQESIFNYEQGIARQARHSLRERKALVRILVKNKLFDSAIYHLGQTILNHPDEIRARALLARIYDLQGRKLNRDQTVKASKAVNISETEKFYQAFLDLNLTEF